MNKNFSKQYENSISNITDGLTHRLAMNLLDTKVSQNLIPSATLTGYKDATAGIYDKYWRYSTDQEADYLAGVQAAINNGASIEQYIECDIEKGVGTYGKNTT